MPEVSYANSFEYSAMQQAEEISVVQTVIGTPMVCCDERISEVSSHVNFELELLNEKAANPFRNEKEPYSLAPSVIVRKDTVGPRGLVKTGVFHVETQEEIIHVPSQIAYERQFLAAHGPPGFPEPDFKSVDADILLLEARTEAK